MATEIILKQLFIFALLIAIGAIANLRGIISNEIKNALSRIIIDVTLPFLIFTTFTGMKFDPTFLLNGLLVFVFAFTNFLVLGFIGLLSSRVLGLRDASKTVHTLHTILGNTVFLAFPLLDALFPNGVGVFYGAIYQLASNTVTFTYGIYRLSNGSHRSGWKSLVNVNTMALALGFMFILLGINLPAPFRVAFESLGKCTSPLSMVYIGALLATLNLKKAFLQKSVYLISFNKLLFAPILLSFIYFNGMKMLGIEMDPVAFFVLILQAAMPCQTIVVVLSQRFNSDHELAAANLFVTTLLSEITLPVIYVFLSWLTGFH